jgi:hypothetical protein
MLIAAWAIIYEGSHHLISYSVGSNWNAFHRRSLLRIMQKNFNIIKASGLHYGTVIIGRDILDMAMQS